MVGLAPSRNVSRPPMPSSIFLTQLRRAHQELLGEMENLGRMTIGPQPGPEEIISGRWRIGQASLRRRTVAFRAFDFLADRLDGEERVQLMRVQSADRDMMRRSAAHVGTWTNQAVCQDWDGYCRASRAIRAHMKSHILFERRWLFPLLQRLTERGT